MKNTIPEKAKLLDKLRKNGFNVPDFIYVPADKFNSEDFTQLNSFLDKHRESYKVIARSAHPMESNYKGGTFDSLETYADIAGIKYARKRMIKIAETSKRLSIQRQQIFNHAPDININEMGVIVMPFINGSSVMAKMIVNHWEFGYCRDRERKVQREPYITKVPHDRKLLQLSIDIQKNLGFSCEIEYIVSTDGEIHVVQAKDISNIETLEEKESERSIMLDGVRRMRKRKNYRERPVYIMDNKAFYINIISQCENLIQVNKGPKPDINDILAGIKAYEKELESFALRHQRFAVIGFSIQDTGELYQIANHYLDDLPDLQNTLSKALHNNIYKIDIFLSEADTLIAKDKFRLNLCSHDAYGIDSVRNPLWSAYWNIDRHDQVVKDFLRLGFKTGDTIAIDIDAEDRPMVYRH
ncbi:hypothetical protein [Desulfobacula toluolica]|uniref:Conserved uncharacterized protein n=1 Tax=Desulfobacula toluolica (strain DSM 7467 / Tol2) TaxID=651182 RepID=K0NFR2_DESTT|nr:hypothetical protein [Desulfobacula toluolica]CCK79785.1 conserved uncharacterized protein [Desulfobacula toluolica Tol2]